MLVGFQDEGGVYLERDGGVIADQVGHEHARRIVRVDGYHHGPTRLVWEGVLESFPFCRGAAKDVSETERDKIWTRVGTYF